jgi:hypothetical protein
MSDVDVTEVEVVLDGVRFYVEARQDSTEHEVGSTLTEGLGTVMDAIKTLGSHVADAAKAIEPDHFGIQLGFEFKLEQGTLVAMLVRGSATASVTVNLQWDSASLGPAAPPNASLGLAAPRSASPGPAAPRSASPGPAAPRSASPGPAAPPKAPPPGK